MAVFLGDPGVALFVAVSRQIVSVFDDAFDLQTGARGAFRSARSGKTGGTWVSLLAAGSVKTARALRAGRTGGTDRAALTLRTLRTDRTWYSNAARSKAAAA